MSDIKTSVQRIQQAKKSIADAIEAKGVDVPEGTKIDGMPPLIEQIETGTDTSDATATADNIEYGKTAYTAKGKEAGTLNKTSSLASTKASVTAIRKTPMVGSAFYQIKMEADELTAPSSSGRYIIDAAKVNVSMVVDAAKFGDAAASNVLKGKTFTSSAGLKVAGTHVCKQPSLQSKSVTPSASSQTVQPDSGYDGLSSVAVAGDANLLPKNVVKDVSIFGVTGTHECPAPKLHKKQITPSANPKTYYPDDGYDGISKISVVGDPDLSPENVMYGKQIFDVVGSHKCPTFQTQAKSVTPTAAAQTVTPDANYDGLSSVSVAGDANLIPANIKKNTKIFGVTGEMETGIDTSDATATENDIVDGVFAYAKGKKIAGALSTIMSYPTTPSFVDEQIRFPYSGSRSIVENGSFFYSTASKFGDAIASDVAKGKTFTSAAGVSVVGTRESESGGIDTSDATATASDIAKDKTAYVNGEKVIGTVESKDSLYNTLSNSSVYSNDPSASFLTSNGSGTFNSPARMRFAYNIQNQNPLMLKLNTSVAVSVRATAFGNASPADVAKGKTFTSASGLKVEGTYEAASTTPNLQTKSVTPKAASQTVTADAEYDGLSSVTVAGDANLKAENIVKDVSIFGVTGTHTCKQPSLQTKSVTPSTAAKTVTADSGYDGLSQVTVAGDSNLIAANIKKGVSIFGIAGTHETTATGGSSDNNCEAYAIDATNPTVSFKQSGTIKVYGYGYTTSSSGWGGSSTTVLAFCGDAYYQSAIYGSPTKKTCTFGVSNGKLTGLPTLNGGTLIAVVGV